jgi:uncharacterized protein YprB with RNaseH-like and TPR domain
LITEALIHCAGIGPARLAQLYERDIRTWADVVDAEDCLSGVCWRRLVEESRRCLAALDAGEIHYFTSHFASQDKWRILSHFLDQASYFDIETVGLEHDAAITVISCWHAGRLHNFVEHENLDDFLELLDEIKLLVSFNGSSFDVPRILDTFHIPALPCAHLDMRWTCFHQGLTGGLKEIADQAGIVRPVDLQSADGELAVRLWFDWRNCQNRAARELLIRYCASDVLMLVMLAHQHAGRDDVSQDELWSHLPDAPQTVLGSTASPAVQTASDGSFGAAFESQYGAGSPKLLRARRSRLVG